MRIFIQSRVKSDIKIEFYTPKYFPKAFLIKKKSLHKGHEKINSLFKKWSIVRLLNTGGGYNNKK